VDSVEDQVSPLRGLPCCVLDAARTAEKNGSRRGLLKRYDAQRPEPTAPGWADVDAHHTCVASTLAGTLLAGRVCPMRPPRGAALQVRGPIRGCFFAREVAGRPTRPDPGQGGRRTKAERSPEQSGSPQAVQQLSISGVDVHIGTCRSPGSARRNARRQPFTAMLASCPGAVPTRRQALGRGQLLKGDEEPARAPGIEPASTMSGRQLPSL